MAEGIILASAYAPTVLRVALASAMFSLIIYSVERGSL